MLANLNGKLLVYASTCESHGSRLRSVSAAAERMAKLLDLDVEVVTLEDDFGPIYVYYKNGDEEPIPIYCNKGEKSNLQEISSALKNMMFVLSFHPKHSALKRIRKEIMLFS
jgi:hypothetical protein